ncbi:MAG: polysaccharide biosynthesis C-terminal domain-containing protein [Elusimicrobia bacterium]|nr:polysaccharide biosynthesis C-terminal domain-containing protein [Elusimicrobiota bacterium]
MDNKSSNFYSKILLSTGKYMVLKNIFMVVTGLFGIFIVRLLGPYEYGRYSLIWQLIGTIGPIISLGWMITLSKFIPERTNFQEKSILYSQSVSLVTILGVSLGLIFFFISTPLAKYIPVEIRSMRLIFIVFILLTAWFNISEGMFRGLGKFNGFTIIDGLRSNLGNALAIILIVYGLRNYTSILFSNCLFSLIFIIGIGLYLKDYFHFTSLKLEPAVAKFAGTILAGQVLFLLMSSIDFILLRILLKDPSQIGFYTAGIKIPTMIQSMLITPLSIPFLYYFSHNDGLQSREKIFEFGTKYLGLVFALMALFFFSFSKETILILLGKDYANSILVLMFSSLSLFTLGFSTLFNPYFSSINKPYVPLYASCITFISLFTCNLLLIPHFKSIGPAISTIISHTLQILTLCIFLSKTKMPFIKNFGLIAFNMAFSILIGVFVNRYLILPVFIITTFATRLFTFKDIENLKKIIRRRE